MRSNLCHVSTKSRLNQFINITLDSVNLMTIKLYIYIYMLWRKFKSWLTNVWLECDSTLICVAFTARTNVHWMLCNRWNICLNYCEKIRFRVIHIFREGNACVDKLANLGFIHKESFHWYKMFPSSLFLEFFINRYSLSMYRFC